MARERRPRDDDDDDGDRPRRRRQRDDEDEEGKDDAQRKRPRRDDDEDEDDGGPRRKRPRDEEDDGDDAPRKRRRDAEDEEEDDRPRRKRPRDDDEKDDDVDDRPRKRRRSRDDDDDEDSDDEPEELTEEEQEKELVREKMKARTQYDDLSAGIMRFRQRARLFLYCTGVLVASIGFAYLTFALYEMDPRVITILGNLVFLAVPQVVAFRAGASCRKGPSGVGGGGLLAMDTILCIVVMLCLFGGSVMAYLFLVDRPKQEERNIGLIVAEVIWGLGLFFYFVTFIVELFYLRYPARFLKDKVHAREAFNVALQHLLINLGCVPLIGVAIFFARGMEGMGNILIGAMVLVYLMFVIKSFFDMMGVCTGVRIAIDRKLRAEDKPEW